MLSTLRLMPRDGSEENRTSRQRQSGRFRNYRMQVVVRSKSQINFLLMFRQCTDIKLRSHATQTHNKIDVRRSLSGFDAALSRPGVWQAHGEPSPQSSTLQAQRKEEAPAYTFARHVVVCCLDSLATTAPSIPKLSLASAVPEIHYEGAT